MHPSFNLHDVVKGSVINGDNELLQEIFRAAKDPDDPPIVFAWNPASLKLFLAKIAQLPAGASVAPPSLTPVPDGNQGVGHGLRALMSGILRHVASVVHCRVIGGADGVAGLACNARQSLEAMAILGNMFFCNPWFRAVLSSGPPLTVPLATLLMPRPRVSTGECEVLRVEGSPLWT